MKKNYLCYFFLLILLISCSSNEPEILTPENISLEEDILGQWDIEYVEEQAVFPTQVKKVFSKKSENDSSLRVFTLVFKKDMEYHIVHSEGMDSGKYEILDVSTILLSGFGILEKVQISNGKIRGILITDGGAEIAVSANFRNNYEDGDCISFLECNHDQYWLRRYMPFPEEDVSLVYYNYLTFKNDVFGVWWKNIVLNQDTGCMIFITDNLLDNAEFTILAHSSHLLIFRMEFEDEAFLYKYSLNDGSSWDNLNLQIVNLKTSGITEFHYVSLEDEIPNLEDYSKCNLEEDKIFVPDDIFEKELIELGLDDVQDDYVLKSKAEEVTELILNVPLDSDLNQIHDLTGIEGFINLKKLNVENNALTKINISTLTELEELNLNKNQLSSLDCSANNKLRSLEVEGNILSDIIISNSPDLWNLELRNNRLQKIDVSNNIELTDLMLGNNDLSSIDLSENINLWDLTINDNNLTFMDLSNQKELWYLGASNNQLTGINLSGTVALQFLAIGNNHLSLIDLSGLTALQEIYVDNNTLENLVFGEKPQLYLIYAENNELSSLDVSSLEYQYLDLRARDNNLSCIQVNEYQLENNSSGWKIDEAVEISLECN